MRKMPKVFLKRVVQKFSLKKLIFLHQKIIFNKTKTQIIILCIIRIISISNIHYNSRGYSKRKNDATK